MEVRHRLRQQVQSHATSEAPRANPELRKDAAYAIAAEEFGQRSHFVDRQAAKLPSCATSPGIARILHECRQSVDLS